MAAGPSPRGRLYSVRRSALHGRGAFALRAIPPGTRIGEYRGERISEDEADRRYPDDVAGPHHTFLFALRDGVVIDAAVGGNSIRFLNHSCDPNCEAIEEAGRIFIETVRPIGPGEELVYDYNFILPTRHGAAAKRRYPRHCGAPHCRGTILAKKR
ncbi:MAG: SET domain-containing protein [Gemmatimonadetes bacterium]|nr:SET domain-containing protein [Gemmatimonadota bacterium]